MIEGLNVPCGITIPWFADHALWGIKVRRAAGQQRYQQVAGGNIKGCLYLADDIKPGSPILLAEGEFDVLIAQQAGAGLISAAAIGSAANKHINVRWYPKLVTAPSIHVCMDGDQAGNSAASFITGLSRAAHCIYVPQGKDINEFYLLAGYEAVKNWIAALIGNYS
jgi:DNA primase